MKRTRLTLTILMVAATTLIGCGSDSATQKSKSGFQAVFDQEPNIDFERAEIRVAELGLILPDGMECNDITPQADLRCEPNAYVIGPAIMLRGVRTYDLKSGAVEPAWGEVELPLGNYKGFVAVYNTQPGLTHLPIAQQPCADAICLAELDADSFDTGILIGNSNPNQDGLGLFVRGTEFDTGVSFIHEEPGHRVQHYIYPPAEGVDLVRNSQGHLQLQIDPKHFLATVSAQVPADPTLPELVELIQ